MPAKKPFSAVISTLKAGGVGVMPTDTIYGIVGSALREESVERIYRLRKRNPKKPMIILIGDVRDVLRFGVVLDVPTKKILARVWPGKVSVTLPAASGAKKFKYLHRGTKTLAFRLPKPAWLRSVLKETGPLVAPSANFEGESPALTVRASKKYFSDQVDFYVDMGRTTSKPSTLIALSGGTVTVLRKGAVLIDKKARKE